MYGIMQSINVMPHPLPPGAKVGHLPYSVYTEKQIKYGNLPCVLSCVKCVLPGRIFSRLLVLSGLAWPFFFHPSQSAMECHLIKTILMSMGDNTPDVPFGQSTTVPFGQSSAVPFGQSSALPVDSVALVQAIKAAFSDVLLPRQTFLLQVKNEE